ncbi:MAG: Ty1/Copia family ribonuclease HI [Gaiellaceae bacterium]
MGRYLKSTPHMGLTFSTLGNPSLSAFVHFAPTDQPILSGMVGFADANWGPQDASRPNPLHPRLVTTTETRSVTGHIIFMNGGPLMWQANKEARGSRSSCEAEIKAIDECTKAVQWMRHVLTDLSLIDPSIPSCVYNDNQGAVQWCQAFSSKNTRHLNIRENCVREAIHEFWEIEIKHIPGKVNPADLFTKEHKSVEEFMTLRDSFMSPGLDGGCCDVTVGTRAHLGSKQDSGT